MIYLIGGENTYESKNTLERVVNSLKKKGHEIKKVYVSDDNNFQSALAGNDNFGMFGGKSEEIIEICGFDEAKKEDEEKVISIVKPGMDMVIHSRSNWDKRSKFYKFFKKASENGDVRVDEFKLLTGRDLDKWLHEYIKEKGLKIEGNLIQKLIFRVGNDQNILASEVEKLLILQDEGVEINLQTFENVVVDTQNVDIWGLIDVLRSDKAKAFKILDYLMIGLEYEYVMSLFARQIRLLFLALSAGSREGLQSFGIHPFVAGKLISESRNFNLAKIKKLYEKMINIDISVKSGKLDKNLALDLLLVAF